MDSNKEERAQSAPRFVIMKSPRLAAELFEVGTAGPVAQAETVQELVDLLPKRCRLEVIPGS